jgi:hypothetical protein
VSRTLKWLALLVLVGIVLWAIVVPRLIWNDVTNSYEVFYVWPTWNNFLGGQ